MAAAVPIIKVVGIALSAKSAYEGIKNGNLLQAVVGAVGAYYGINSLASGAAGITDQAANEAAKGAAQTTTTAGAATADKVASEVASSAAEEAAKGATQSVAAGAATEAAKIGAQEVAKETAKKSLIASMGNFATQNPELTQAGLNLIGGYAQGVAEEKMQNKLLDKQEAMYRERMHRMGTPGDVSYATSMVWNPETKRFEIGAQ